MRVGFWRDGARAVFSFKREDSTRDNTPALLRLSRSGSVQLLVALITRSFLYAPLSR